MKFYSTKNKNLTVTFAEALFMGLAPDGGLFMPQKIPRLSPLFFQSFERLNFQEIAHYVAEKWIGDEIPSSSLREIVNCAFTFNPELIPLDNEIAVLELFHGPTLSFKDFGARFLAHTMAYFLRKREREVVVLVATSGDTGSAVAHGFLDIHGITVVVLYPSGKVSMIQEKQFATLDKNVIVLEVNGTFDDCQRLVKQAFLDAELNRRLNLASANSINIGRLLPQLFYYFYAYAQVPDKRLPVVFSVPCGNFGNVTAGLIAKQMGLPIERFVAATNSNRTVPEFLETGAYIPRASKQTISSAMDVGDPSNFVRMAHLYGDEVRMRRDMSSFSFTDEETRDTIKKVYEHYTYTLCPHSAIAFAGANKVKSVFGSSESALPARCAQAGNHSQLVFLATAHPSKFIEIVEPIIGEIIEIPARLQACTEKEKHSMLVSREFDAVKEVLLEIAL